MPAKKASSPRRRKVTPSVILAAGFGFVYLVPLTKGKAHDWLEWMAPFAFWAVALLVYWMGVKKDDGLA